MLFLKYDTNSKWRIINQYVEAYKDIFPQDIEITKTQRVAIKIILDVSSQVYIVYKKYMGVQLSTPILAALNGGAVLSGGCEYIFETLMPAHTVFNIRVSNSQTIRLLNLFFEGVAPF